MLDIMVKKKNSRPPFKFSYCIELCRLPRIDDGITVSFLKDSVPSVFRQIHAEDIVCYVFRTLDIYSTDWTYYALYSYANCFPTSAMMHKFFPNTCPYFCYALRIKLNY